MNYFNGMKWLSPDVTVDVDVTSVFHFNSIFIALHNGHSVVTFD